MPGVRRSDVAIGVVLALGGAALQVVLAQRMASAGGSVWPWASLTALITLAAVAVPPAPLRWGLAGVALVGGTATWALLPAGWWAIATLLRRENAQRGIGWFLSGIVVGVAVGWLYFLR